MRKKARYDMNLAIEDMKQSENELSADLQSIATEVKRSQQARRVPELQSLLVTSRSKRQRLGMLKRQRQVLEQQCEQLASVELNEKVMSSVKHTSSALKSLGLESKLGDLDETLLDLKESTEDVNSMNEALGQSLGMPSASDEDLEDELRLLMHDDNSVLLLTPAVSRVTNEGVKPPEKSTASSIMHAPATLNTVCEDADGEHLDQHEQDAPSNALAAVET